MKGKLLAVSMTEKVTELLRQHPVHNDQGHQDYIVTAFAANICKSKNILRISR